MEDAWARGGRGTRHARRSAAPRPKRPSCSRRRDPQNTPRAPPVTLSLSGEPSDPEIPVSAGDEKQLCARVNAVAAAATATGSKTPPPRPLYTTGAPAARGAA